MHREYIAELAERLAELVEERRLGDIRNLAEGEEVSDFAEALNELKREHTGVVFRVLSKETAIRVFEHLPPEQQQNLLRSLGDSEVVRILNELSPDDRTSFLQELPGRVTKRLLNQLEPEQRDVARDLLGYPDESIGRMATPNYIAIKEEWDVDRVLDHIRVYGEASETLDMLFVVDKSDHLIDDIAVRDVLISLPGTPVSDLMDNRFVSLVATDDQEEAVDAFRRYDRTVLPVTDTDGILVGIVTVDDVLDVAEAEATEDIQKLGGTEALTESYLTISLPKLIRKRSGWLVLLFFGQMLTANAMGYFENEIETAIVLAIFIPLIISSGGNTGSQAATLVIRAMTMGEVRLRDWYRVMRREVIAGLVIGNILGVLGFLRVAGGHWFTDSYGPYWALIGLTMWGSLLGVVLWGGLAGSLMPLILKKLRLDPATSSAPFIATLVDVTGLIIYFGTAIFILRGTVL